MAQSILDSVFSGSDGIAKTLINLLGGDATVYLPAAGTYNPLTGDRTGGGFQAGIPIDLSAMEQVTERDIDNTTILKGDFKALVPKSDVTLERAYIDKADIEFNGVRYRLIEYRPTYSGQETAMYTVYLRNL